MSGSGSSPRTQERIGVYDLEGPWTHIRTDFLGSFHWCSFVGLSPDSPGLGRGGRGHRPLLPSPGWTLPTAVVRSLGLLLGVQTSTETDDAHRRTPFVVEPRPSTCAGNTRGPRPDEMGNDKNKDTERDERGEAVRTLVWVGHSQSADEQDEHQNQTSFDPTTMSPTTPLGVDGHDPRVGRSDVGFSVPRSVCVRVRRYVCVKGLPEDSSSLHLLGTE